MSELIDVVPIMAAIVADQLPPKETRNPYRTMDEIEASRREYLRLHPEVRTIVDFTHPSTLRSAPDLKTVERGTYILDRWEIYRKSRTEENQALISVKKTGADLYVSS